MKYTKSITDILEDFIKCMKFGITIYQATQTSPGIWLLDVNDVYHAQVNFTVTIGGNAYTITNVCADDCNMQLTVKGTSTITAISFNLYGVNFFHGTPRQTGEEVSSGSNVITAYPLMWLWDSDTKRVETFNRDPQDAIERESNLNLFFLTRGKADDKRAQQLEETYVAPMRRVKEHFLRLLDEPFSNVQSWEQTDTDKIYTQFAITYQVKGDTKNLFAGELSGVGIEIKLKLYRSGNICC